MADMTPEQMKAETSRLLRLRVIAPQYKDVAEHLERLQAEVDRLRALTAQPEKDWRSGQLPSTPRLSVKASEAASLSPEAMAILEKGAKGLTMHATTTAQPDDVRRDAKRGNSK